MIYFVDVSIYLILSCLCIVMRFTQLDTAGRTSVKWCTNDPYEDVGIVSETCFFRERKPGHIPARHYLLPIVAPLPSSVFTKPSATH